MPKFHSKSETLVFLHVTIWPRAGMLSPDKAPENDQTQIQEYVIAVKSEKTILSYQLWIAVKKIQGKVWDLLNSCKLTQYSVLLI